MLNAVLLKNGRRESTWSECLTENISEFLIQTTNSKVFELELRINDADSLQANWFKLDILGIFDLELYTSLGIEHALWQLFGLDFDSEFHQGEIGASAGNISIFIFQ